MSPLTITYQILNQQSLNIGIEAFFSCSGKLFHVFTREQVEQNYQIIFSNDKQTERKLAISCATAIAAVGNQYLQNPISREEEESFYNLARHHMEDILVEQPLEAVKLYTLLAMYNIMNKATVALAYVEIALGLARKLGLSSRYRSSNISEEIWRDYRRAWTTLMFLSAWLGSTLGYMSGNFSFNQTISLTEFDTNTKDIEEILKLETTKIVILQVNMLRDNFALKDLSSRTIERMLHDLEDWYGKLPKEMHIAVLSQDNLEQNTRRSIYYVHLLYLGTINLLYRRIASHFLKLQLQKIEPELWGHASSIVRRPLTEGYVAAKQAARILGLLLNEKSILSRCWIVM